MADPSAPGLTGELDAGAVEAPSAITRANLAFDMLKTLGIDTSSMQAGSQWVIKYNLSAVLSGSVLGPHIPDPDVNEGKIQYEHRLKLQAALADWAARSSSG